MAKRLDSFNFTLGARGKYPVDEWLDGDIWSLEQGTDFDVSITAVRQALMASANRRGLKLQTSANGNTLVIRAVKRDG